MGVTPGPQKPCPDCHGGGVDSTGSKQCDTCKGKGTVPMNFTKEKQTNMKARHRSGGFNLGPEFRLYQVDGLEVRDGATGSDTIRLSGMPIVYNVPYSVRDYQGEFMETMKPGVAADLIDNGVDCRFLINHGGLPLARTAVGGNPGTMKLIDTDDGLRFTADISARQQLANDLAIACERGDVTQMSCGFMVARDTWGYADGQDTRDVESFQDLIDVSAVTYPASPTTSIEVAQRAALQLMIEMPPESQARLRQFFFMAPDLRAYAEGRSGKVLSKDNAGKLANALDALKQADAAHQSAHASLKDLAKAAGLGTEPADAIGGGNDGSTGGGSTGGNQLGNQDNSGSRTAPPRWSGRSLLEESK